MVGDNSYGGRNTRMCVSIAILLLEVTWNDSLVLHISVPAMLWLISYCMRPSKCVCKCVFVYLFSDSLMHENNPSLGLLLIWFSCLQMLNIYPESQISFLEQIHILGFPGPKAAHAG